MILLGSAGTIEDGSRLRRMLLDIYPCLLTYNFSNYTCLSFSSPTSGLPRTHLFICFTFRSLLPNSLLSTVYFLQFISSNLLLVIYFLALYFLTFYSIILGGERSRHVEKDKHLGDIDSIISLAREILHSSR